MKKYIFTFIFLITFILPSVAISQVTQIDNLKALPDLSGGISITVIKGEPVVYDGSLHLYVDADIKYSGDEDVTMVAFVDGVFKDSVQGNEMYLYDCQWGMNNLTHEIEVIVRADGFNDLHGYETYTDYFWRELRGYGVGGNSGAQNIGGNCYAKGDTLTYNKYLWASYAYYYSSEYISHGDELVCGVRSYSGDISIPSSISVIGDNAFNCYLGEDEWGNEIPYLNPEDKGSLSVPSSITTVEKNAFDYYSPYQLNGPHPLNGVIIESLES